MGWTAPRTWTYDEIVTETIANVHIRDNFKETWHRVDYQEYYGTDVTVPNGVGFAGGTTLFSSALTTVAPVIMEFTASGVEVPSDVDVEFAFTVNGSGTGGTYHLKTAVVAAGVFVFPVHLVRPYPTSGANTFAIRVWSNNAGASVFGGGDGGDAMQWQVWEKGGA